MVLHNPNNWHWVNKDVSAWAREYLENDLVGLSAEEDGNSAKINKVLSMDGDVDVSQRKGKVITLFDVKLQLEYQGLTKDGENVSGKITVPEVAHDTEEDEYVFDVELYSESAEKQPVRDLVRKSLTPTLRKHLSKLGPALIAEHGKDIQHAPNSNPNSGFSTPKYLSNSNSLNKAGSSSLSAQLDELSTNSASNINVTTLTSDTEFRTTADELYKTFTDPQRIAAFTRGAPKTFDGAKSGGKFEIFDGNVSGEYAELAPPTKIVQKWRLRQWPQGHYSELKIEFDQNNVDAVTVMRVAWKGVPVGQEEVTRRNWEEYYVNSIKRTFGFGTIL